jgi:tRNA pseudouridine55 synthase
LQDREKEYVARICFGVATDTLDADGAIVSREPMPVTQEELERVLGRFLGVVYQIPPMVSALKVGGRRLYRLARQGVEVERAPRPVRILQLEVLEFAPSRYPEATLRVVCGSGTYVRVLAQDIAAALGGYAHLSALRRLRVGHLEAGRHGLSLDQIDRWREHLLTPAEGIALPRIEVDPVTAEGVSHGLRFATGPLSRSNLEGVAAVIGPGGSLLAVYREGNPEVVLA